MARKLSPLPQTQFSGLEFANIRDDVINLVTDSPNYNTSWDDFLSSDAGRMMIELFAYIADNLATRIDWVANENWLSTATQKASIMRILKILGYNFTLPYAAGVAVKTTIPSSGYGDSWPGKFYLTPTYTQGVTFAPYSLIAKDKKGVSKTYEALPYDSVNNRYDYKVGILIGDTFGTAGSGDINFYEGKTYIETFTVSTDNAYSFTLNKSPVIEGSPRIYFANDNLMTETELVKVTSFLDVEAQQITDPITGLERPIAYVLSVEENDTVTISFGPTSLLPTTSRRPATGDKIRVFYRVGGGLDGNLVRDAINTVQLVSISPIINPTNVRSIHIGFENLSEGQGGQDAESTEHAIVYAPLSIRTVEKAVTSEDYEILLNANTNIITAKSYGAGNAPVNVYARYGVNINPTEVWNYVVPKAAGWSSLITSKYNDFYWMSLYLDNRFNEQYAFRTGAFNYTNTIQTSNLLGRTKLGGDSIAWSATAGDTFYNYVLLDTPVDLKNHIVGDTDFRAIITSTIDTTQQFIGLQNKLVGDTIFAGVVPANDRYRIIQPIQSYFISTVDLSEGIDLSASRFIKLNIDNNGDTVVDVSTKAINLKKTNAFEIAKAINDKLASLPAYGNDYGDSLGVKGGASVVEIGSADYLKIQGYRKGNSILGDTIGARLNILKVQSGLLIGGIIYGDATSLVLGTDIAGDTFCCRGYRGLTLIKNSGLSSFGKIIYEHGSHGLFPDPSILYLHYLTGDTQYVKLGTYSYYNFIQGTDVEWRNIANRVYNTVLKTGDSIPDMSLSDFQLKFTKTATTYPSLYKINNDWTLYYASPASVTSPTLGDTITLAKGRYRLNIGIDGRGDTLIVIAGDSGGDSRYLLSKIGDTINNQLRTIYGLETWTGDSYSTYTYAKIDNLYKRLTITSPFISNNSQVRLSNILGTTPASPSANGNLFGLNETTSYVYKVKGDYYLNHNRTLDLMELVKTNNGYSQMPDGTFYTHFLWDRRNSTSVDEYTYQTYLQNKKLLGIDNVFKQAKFGTFDITGIIYFNKAYSSSVIKSNVENALTNEFSFMSSGIVKRDFAQSIIRSKIESIIHGIAGVEYVTLGYFGRDMGDPLTNEENEIVAEFDEILVVSDNVTSGSTQIHGVKFDYLVFNG